MKDAHQGEGLAFPLLLELRDVEAIYGQAVLALKGVSLTVKAGQIVALLGANGAGKTTTLRAISNLLLTQRGAVSAGSIRLRGESIERTSAPELVRRGMVQVLEGRHCFSHLSIHENLLAGAFTRRDKGEIDANIEKVYRYFPRLKTRSRSKAAYASGGEQQMCAIGRALMSNPSVVLLDEPSMGLAPQIVEEVFEIVKSLNEKEGVTFLVAEQNATVALRYAHYGFVMEDGRVLLGGTASELSNDPEIQELYLGSGSRRSFRDFEPRTRPGSPAN